jgi:glycosyltransferase involved in cell wall biosynthesis
MKITYGISVYWPAINGASIFTHQLARSIAEVYEVKVITQSKENRHDWLYTPTLGSKGSFEYYDGYAKVHLVGTGRFERLFLWPAVNFYYSFNSISSKILCSIFRRKIFPLVKGSTFVHNFLLDMDYFNYLLWESARHINVPYIVTPFVHYSSHWQREFSSLRFSLLRKADRIVTLTHAEKNWLGVQGINHKKIYVVEGGPVISSNFDSCSFREKYKIEGKMVLFIATKRKYKGYPLILEAMSEVWSKHPDTYFVFIGLQTPQSQEIFKYYQDRRVIDIGLVDLEEKTSALAACDIFCMPSIFESFGMVFTEAWAMSKPVIGGDCLSTAEIIDDGKNGFIVPQDSKIVAQKLNLLLGDDILRQQMGETGRKKVRENYTWEKSVDKLKRIYIKLVS